MADRLPPLVTLMADLVSLSPRASFWPALYLETDSTVVLVYDHGHATWHLVCGEGVESTWRHVVGDSTFPHRTKELKGLYLRMGRSESL